MNLNDKNKNFTMSLADDTENGYYFLLKDTLHHCDYNVVLVKDTGDITVNGDYIKDVPFELANLIKPRLDYFMAKKHAVEHMKKHHHAVEKKNEKKPSEKKTVEKKKGEKKEVKEKK